jgi:hypothetical protein
MKRCTSTIRVGRSSWFLPAKVGPDGLFYECLDAFEALADRLIGLVYSLNPIPIPRYSPPCGIGQTHFEESDFGSDIAVNGTRGAESQECSFDFPKENESGSKPAGNIVDAFARSVSETSFGFVNSVAEFLGDFIVRAL